MPYDFETAERNLARRKELVAVMGRSNVPWRWPRFWKALAECRHLEREYRAILDAADDSR